MKRLGLEIHARLGLWTAVCGDKRGRYLVKWTGVEEVRNRALQAVQNITHCVLRYRYCPDPTSCPVLLKYRWSSSHYPANNAHAELAL